jgi:hypothetical protein
MAPAIVFSQERAYSRLKSQHLHPTPRSVSERFVVASSTGTAGSQSNPNEGETLRTRILLHSALAAMAIGLVMADAASASQPNISPTGTFTSTASNAEITWPGNSRYPGGATINCKSSTLGGLVHATEGVGNAVTGSEPPTFKECEVHNGWLPQYAGVAKISATVPIESFAFVLQTPKPGLNVGMAVPLLHIRTEQALGVDCNFEIRGIISYRTFEGYGPFVLSEVALSGNGTFSTYTKDTGICKELYGPDASVTGTYKLNHPLTVSSSG